MPEKGKESGKEKAMLGIANGLGGTKGNERRRSGSTS